MARRSIWLAEAVRPGRAAHQHRRRTAHRVRAVAADHRRRAGAGVRVAVQPGGRRVQRRAGEGDQAAQRQRGAPGLRAQVHRPLHAAARHDPAPGRLRWVTVTSSVVLAHAHKSSPKSRAL